MPTAPHASKDFKPFLLNACFEWFVANGWTTYVGAYSALPGVVIPKDRAVNGQILISLSKDAVDDLKICVQSEVISCNAYFDGVPTKIEIPIEAVFCIYAKETNQGLSWTCDESSENDHSSNEDSSQNDVQARPPATPMLVVVKS